MLIKHQLRNLNRLNLNFKILTKPTFSISIKIKLHNLNYASAAKYWPNFSIKNLAWTSTSNSWPNLVLKVWANFFSMTELQLPNLHQTVVNTFLSIYISNSNKLIKFWVDIFTRTRQGHINEVYYTGVWELRSHQKGLLPHQGIQERPSFEAKWTEAFALAQTFEGSSLKHSPCVCH